MVSNQILLGLLFSVLPGLESIVGIPLIIEYSIKNNINFVPWVLLSSLLNILTIGFVFLFLDYLHVHFLKIKIYKKVIGHFFDRIHRQREKFENKLDKWGYIALMAFVALPFPGNGAWTCATLSWMVGLNRKKSWIAIALGLIISDIIVLLASLGIWGL